MELPARPPSYESFLLTSFDSHSLRQTFFMFPSSERMTPHPISFRRLKKSHCISVQLFLRVHCQPHTSFPFLSVLFSLRVKTHARICTSIILGGPRLFFTFFSLFFSMFPVLLPALFPLSFYFFPFVSVAYICAAHILIIALY